MVFSKKCQRYLNKRNHKIKRLLEKTHDGYDKEDYHDLRLEIKKVKALVTMLSYLTKIKKKKILKPYKLIFKVAGQVRDAQMAHELLAKQKPLKWLQQYRHELETEILLHEKEFFLFVSEKEQNFKDVWRKIKLRGDQVKRKGGEDYVIAEKKKIAGIIGRSKISMEAAHEMRKRLKSIGYIAKLIKVKNPSESMRIEQIQEALGVWHDHRQLAERLKKDAAGTKDKQRKLHILNLEYTVSKKAQMMFGQISGSLRSLKESTLKSPAKGEALLF